MRANRRGQTLKWTDGQKIVQGSFNFEKKDPKILCTFFKPLGIININCAISFLSGTRSYTPPEFTKSKQYNGCQGTVWQMGILLVDMLSPDIRAFKHPRDALTMPPRVPKELSPGNSLALHESYIWATTNFSELSDILALR